MKKGDPIEIDGHRFEVVEPLGAGRTADVFLVRSRGGSERVVKALRDPERAAITPTDFLAEAEVLDRLRAIDARHGRDGRASHFPAVYLRDAERCLFAMERATGRALADIVGRTVLSIEQCLSVALQLGEALGVAIEAGVYNADLKLDSVIWEPQGDRLVVIDWNVHRPWPPEGRGRWFDPYTAMVAEVLDRLLRDLYGEAQDQEPDWSRPFKRAPRRWSDYLRVFQLLFTEMLADPARWSVAELGARLRRIEAALSAEPEGLLRSLIEGMVAARGEAAGRVERLEEALAFAELAANVRHPGVVFRARELIGQAVDLLGGDAEAIETLRRAVRGEGHEIHVPPGDAIELHRLKRMAHAGHAVLGAADDLRRVAESYEHLRWQTASGALDELLRRFAGQETLVEELTPLADEAAGLWRCATGLKYLGDATVLEVPDGTMHGFDPEALQALEAERVLAFDQAAEHIDAGVERLRRVPWFPALTVRFPEIEAVAGQIRAEAAAARGALAARAARRRAVEGEAAEAAGGRADPAAVASPVADARSALESEDSTRATAVDWPAVDDAADEAQALDDDPIAPTPRRGAALVALLLAAALAAAAWLLWPRDDGRALADAEVDAGPIRIGNTPPAARADAGIDATAGAVDAAPPKPDAGIRDARVVDQGRPPPARNRRGGRLSDPRLKRPVNRDAAVPAPARDAAVPAPAQTDAIPW